MKFIVWICVVMNSLSMWAVDCEQVPPVKSREITELNTDGFVEVSLKIDRDGRIEVISIQSSNEQLADYVLKKLAQTKLSPGSSEPGKVVKYRFVFKKQA